MRKGWPRKLRNTASHWRTRRRLVHPALRPRPLLGQSHPDSQRQPRALGTAGQRQAQSTKTKRQQPWPQGQSSPTPISENTKQTFYWNTATNKTSLWEAVRHWLSLWTPGIFTWSKGGPATCWHVILDNLLTHLCAQVLSPVKWR